MSEYLSSFFFFHEFKSFVYFITFNNLFLFLHLIFSCHYFMFDFNLSKPNIMLSKWRGGDLPVEHKKNFESTDVCDDKKLCEVIIDGAEKNADKIYNILWNFATK